MHQLLRFIAIILTICIVCLNPLGFTQVAPSTNVAGGSGGDPFSDFDLPTGARVLAIHIYSGGYVDAVQMQYSLADGRIRMGTKHGGPGGQLSIFRVDSDEIILGISGRYGNYIDSIQIHTTKRNSPVFGGSGGRQSYRINIPTGNQAIGFIGRAGKYLDAVGLTYIPQMINRIAFTSIAGGPGGTEFSDSEILLRSRVSEIRIHANKFVDSIQPVYTLQEGTLFEGPVHGGNGGRSYVFKLDPDEYVTGISGRYGNYIDSLVIITNKRTSQNYGGNGGRNDFRIDVPTGSQGLGFIGRAGKYLDAIGIAYAPLGNSSRRGNRFRSGR